jgi:hypothetical protein
MRVRTRNRIVIGVRLTILTSLAGFGLYKYYQVESKDAVHVAVDGIISFIIVLVVTEIYIRRLRRASKQMRDELGLKREDLSTVEEAPIPLLPSPLLPKGKKELARAAFFIVLLVVLLILSWTGMLKKWFVD